MIVGWRVSFIAASRLKELKCMNGDRVNAFFKAVLHNPLLVHQSQILLRCVRYWWTKKSKNAVGQKCLLIN